MSKVITDKSNYANIANAIRQRTHKKYTMLPSEMPEHILEDIPHMNILVQVANHCDDDGIWHRPEGWPDLDSLTIGEDEVYMTIDNSGRFDDPHISCTVTISSGSTAKWEIGSIVDSSFVACETITGTTINRLFTDSDPNFPVVRFSGKITNWNYTAQSYNSHSYVARYQAVLERVGSLYDFGTGVWGCYFVEREKVKRAACSAAGLSSTWNSCYSLQSLDLSGWDTSGWAVTSLSSTWYYCYSLQSLDLSGWDTARFTSASAERLTYITRALRSLNISGLDVSKLTQWGSSSYAQATSNMLETFVCGANNYGKFNPTAYTTLNLSSSVLLSHDSLLEFSQMLAQVSAAHTLTLGSELQNKLTAAEKAAITAKGWSIA